jgi:phosphoribosylglycinamide formyltransferase 2
MTTSRYLFAETRAEAMAAATTIGLPAVVKPVMSSSGKGQSVAHSEEELGASFDYAVANMRGERVQVIVEQFIDFDYEITLLTVATRDGILFCPPVGHRQEGGDYRESWQPAAMRADVLASAQEQATKVVEALGGFGLFGVEFFISGDQAIFSELSPRPHDTGMVTLIGQSPNEFELHVRAILGLPIPAIESNGPAASAVILGDREADSFTFEGVSQAIGFGRDGAPVDLRLFAKPVMHRGRRMGIALARGATIEEAVMTATNAASAITIVDRA